MNFFSIFYLDVNIYLKTYFEREIQTFVTKLGKHKFCTELIPIGKLLLTEGKKEFYFSLTCESPYPSRNLVLSYQALCTVKYVKTTEPELRILHVLSFKMINFLKL